MDQKPIVVVNPPLHFSSHMIVHESEKATFQKSFGKLGNEIWSDHMINTFIEKSYTKYGGETSLRPCL